MPQSLLQSLPEPFETSTRVALVRHGETDWNAGQRLQGHADRELNDRGHAQARAVASLLAVTEWDGLISSPLSRARQTAATIGEVLRIPHMVIDDGLIEQHFGDAEGMIASDARRQWPDGAFTGGETRLQVAARVQTVWQTISQQHAGSSVVIVCHGVVIRCLSEFILGEDPGMVPNGSALLLREQRGRWTRDR